MDYYNIKLFPEISIKQLLIDFKSLNLISTGSVSVWKDEMGKPGDGIYHLQNIDWNSVESKLKFFFGSNTTIEILNPEGTRVNTKIICVEFAKKIVWSTGGLELLFEKTGEGITTISVNGEHIFKPDFSAPAFLMYAW